jgi:perosamine synthetase
MSALSRTTPRGRQPPVHSPLSIPALCRGAAAAVAGPDPRLALAARLERTYDADHLLLTDSGTDALQVAIAVARQVVSPTAPVALPAYSCFDVATAAVGADATIALYDLDPRTLGPDLESLKRCLVRGARTVVVAPLYGVPLDWGPIRAAVESHGAVLIEDAAQGHGATWDRRPLGGLAAVSVLSFGRGKGWTGGSGGAVLFRAPAPWDDTLTLLGDRSTLAEVGGVARAAGQWLFARPALYGIPARAPGLHLGETRYRAPRTARPMRRSAARLLEATAREAEVEAESRRRAGEWYTWALSHDPVVQRIVPPAGGAPGWLRYPVLLGAGLEDGDEGARALGIAPGYPHPLSELPAVRERLVSWAQDHACPGAWSLAHRLVTLPTHSLLTMEDRRRVAELVERYAERWGGSRRA